MNDTRQEIGLRLRQIRTQLGESQTVFAHRFGVSRQDISSYERGRREIPVRVLAELERLGFRSGWLLGQEGDMLLPRPTGTDPPPVESLSTVAAGATAARREFDFRWLLAVPAAILTLLLTDLILPLIFGFLYYATDHITTFLSHLAAVVVAGRLSPKSFLRQIVVALVALFISLRLVMIVPVLDSAGDSVGRYVIDTLSAISGLGLGMVLLFRKPGGGESRRKE